MTQINTIDLTRRSPSYENRLSKYSHRGFEIYWPLLDRSRIDPTLFERSFGRTLGLARLLVLEKLPKNTDREAYVDQRRAERGRPTINRWGSRKLKGNMKEDHDDEVAEWVETDEVSVRNVYVRTACETYTDFVHLPLGLPHVHHSVRSQVPRAQDRETALRQGSTAQCRVEPAEGS
jgi:hypothetical protein